MSWFDGWFGSRDERNIPKLDDTKKDTVRDVLDISNLDGYNIVESNFAVNTINDVEHAFNLAAYGLSVRKGQWRAASISKLNPCSFAIGESLNWRKDFRTGKHRKIKPKVIFSFDTHLSSITATLILITVRN